MVVSQDMPPHTGATRRWTAALQLDGQAVVAERSPPATPEDPPCVHAHIHTCITRPHTTLHVSCGDKGSASVAPGFGWATLAAADMPGIATLRDSLRCSVLLSVLMLCVVCRPVELGEPDQSFTADQIATMQGVGDGTVGAGGCIAYALFKLGVYPSIGAASQALDNAGEAIFQRRVHEHKPSPRTGLCYPKAKVYTAGLTWCPEAIQHAVQATRHRLHKVYPAPASSTHMPAKLQTLIESTGHSAQMLLLEGTLAQTSVRDIGGCIKQITIDVEDPSPEERPELWRHTLAIRDGKLFDLYNPRGLHVTNLRLMDNVVGDGGYMCGVAKVWSVKPPASRGKRKEWAVWASVPAQRMKK
jgi:hypothetical protein